MTQTTLDLDNLNSIQLPRENMHYIDRARRSISTEARQANLIDQIAQFNAIPKLYDIKFDLSALQEEDATTAANET